MDIVADSQCVDVVRCVDKEILNLRCRDQTTPEAYHDAATFDAFRCKETLAGDMGFGNDENFVDPRVLVWMLYDHSYSFSSTRVELVSYDEPPFSVTIPLGDGHSKDRRSPMHILVH